MNAQFDPTLFITMFADASWCPNTTAYGYGFWIKYGTPATTIRQSNGGYTKSSLEAEVLALRAGINHISIHLREQMQGKRIVVQSDCIGALARIQPDLLRLRNLGAQAAYSKHVKGHRGHQDVRASVNTWCDKAAHSAMRQFRELKR